MRKAERETNPGGPRSIPCSKYHGYGNDFLVMAADVVAVADQPQLSRAICQPHFGVGADGCAFLSKRGPDRLSVRLFNRDGSEAGMSGNGVRCCCAYAHHRGLAQGELLVLETKAGPRSYQLIESGDLAWTYRSRMGKPSFDPRRIPCRAPSGLDSIRDHPLEVAGDTVRIRALWVGNPQCVAFVEDLLPPEKFRSWGAGLERHSFFPDRANVGFVRVDSEDHLTLRIWERGVGPTCSSGTGSCGAAVAAIDAGLARSPVTVETETGSQVVEWSSGEEIVLTGEAAFVADVEFCWRG